MMIPNRGSVAVVSDQPSATPLVFQHVAKGSDAWRYAADDASRVDLTLVGEPKSLMTDLLRSLTANLDFNQSTFQIPLRGMMHVPSAATFGSVIFVDTSTMGEQLIHRRAWGRSKFCAYTNDSAGFRMEIRGDVSGVGYGMTPEDWTAGDWEPVYDEKRDESRPGDADFGAVTVASVDTVGRSAVTLLNESDSVIGNVVVNGNPYSIPPSQWLEFAVDRGEAEMHFAGRGADRYLVDPGSGTGPSFPSFRLHNGGPAPVTVVKGVHNG
jgi:hypothetical protein